MKIGLGFDLKTKVPWTFILAIVAVLLVGLYFALVFFEIMETTTIFQWVVGFIFTWTFLVVFAILGGIFLGMFIATRTLSAKGLTPFEASMLRMHEEVRTLTRQVSELTKEVRTLPHHVSELTEEGRDMESPTPGSENLEDDPDMKVR